MRNRRTVILAALLCLLLPTVLMAQTSAKRKTGAAVQSGAPGGTEPLRVISGEMRGGTVTGQFKQRSTPFSFRFTKADVVGDRLQLTGDFALGGSPAAAREQIKATVVGTMSKAANPWPSANDRSSRDSKSKEKAGEQQQGREAKTPEATGQLGQLAQSTQDTARKTPPAPGEKTEQTQSLYAQAETSTGCGVLFLSFALPQRLRTRVGRVAEPLQLGVVVKSFDNPRGEEINAQICRFLQTTDSQARSLSLDQLNRLLQIDRK